MLYSDGYRDGFRDASVVSPLASALTVEAGAAEGLEADLVRSFKGRDVPDTGDIVAVYRDLSGAPKSGYPAKSSWSIKNQKSGVVVAHTQGLRIVGVESSFLESARRDYQKSVSRGVHAFLTGEVDYYVSSGSGRGVSYYPDLSVFFFKDNRKQFLGAEAVTFSFDKCLAEGGKEGQDVMPRSRFESCWECAAGRMEPCEHDVAAVWELELVSHQSHR